jgi:hypothetical protein
MRSLRQNSRHTRAHRALADHEFAFARNEGGVTDSYASDIGDGIERAGRAIERHAKITGARFGCGFFLREGWNRNEKERQN